jgi:hypothetical protein
MIGCNNKQMKWAVMASVVSFLVAAMLCPAYGGESCEKRIPLFYIERNKNGNIVNYDICLDMNNKISASDPVRVYWVTEDGKTSELNLAEKKLAYGVKTIQQNDGKSIEFALVALKDRLITVEMTGGKYQAIIHSTQGEIVVEKLYVHATEGILGLPTINYVDVTGRSPAGNARLTERITQGPKIKASPGSEVYGLETTE